MTDALAESAVSGRVHITEQRDDGRYRVTVNRLPKASLTFTLSAVELAYLEQAAGQILRPAQVNNPDEMRWQPTPENHRKEIIGGD